jgi:hypothetical protein
LDKAFICLHMHDNIGGGGGRGGRRASQREVEMLEIDANWILDIEHRKRIGEWKFGGGKDVGSQCVVRLGVRVM